MNDTMASVDLKSRLAADPGVILETAAREHGGSLASVVDALPAAMRRFAPGSSFVDVTGEVAKWGDVTLIIHSDDGVMEFTGPVPEGTVASRLHYANKAFRAAIAADARPGRGFR